LTISVRPKPVLKIKAGDLYPVLVLKPFKTGFDVPRDQVEALSVFLFGETGPEK
jgi:hypothetical protein